MRFDRPCSFFLSSVDLTIVLRNQTDRRRFGHKQKVKALFLELTSLDSKCQVVLLILYRNAPPPSFIIEVTVQYIVAVVRLKVYKLRSIDAQKRMPTHTLVTLNTLPLSCSHCIECRLVARVELPFVRLTPILRPNLPPP